MPVDHQRACPSLAASATAPARTAAMMAAAPETAPETAAPLHPPHAPLPGVRQVPWQARLLLPGQPGLRQLLRRLQRSCCIRSMLPSVPNRRALPRRLGRSSASRCAATLCTMCRCAVTDNSKRGMCGVQVQPAVTHLPGHLAQGHARHISTIAVRLQLES